MTVAETLRTPDEWCEHYGLVIADPDGWRGRDAPPWEQPLGLAEFWARFNHCTARRVDDETAARIIRDIRAAREDEQADDRFTALQAGRCEFSKPYVARLGGTVQVQISQSRPGLLADPGAWRALVGGRIAINGPRVIDGVLRSVAAAEDGLSVTLHVEKARTNILANARARATRRLRMTDETPGFIRPFDLAAPSRNPASMLAITPLRALPGTAEREALDAKTQAEDRKREARVNTELRAAHSLWERFVNRFLGSETAPDARAWGAALVSALRLHEPQAGHERVECAECMVDGFECADPAAWPCATFNAIGRAL